LVPRRTVNTDEEFEIAIRRNGISNLHPVGTCRMGPDEGAVVDPRLRVVDGPIIPTVLAGNTNAPTIMIGEKASDMILEDARATA
jgi:choline dehydrogenase